MKDAMTQDEILLTILIQIWQWKVNISIKYLAARTNKTPLSSNSQTLFVGRVLV